MTSWVMGLRNSLLPMERGLLIGGFSKWRLLPWITSLRFAIDLEHPDKPPPHPAEGREELAVEIRLVEIVVRRCFVGLGTWTSDGSDLQWRDFLRENQTVGKLLFFFLLLFLSL